MLEGSKKKKEIHLSVLLLIWQLFLCPPVAPRKAHVTFFFSLMANIMVILCKPWFFRKDCFKFVSCEIFLKLIKAEVV